MFVYGKIYGAVYWTSTHFHQEVFMPHPFQQLHHVCVVVNDLEAAVAEGATLVRIGTAIFGERHYA